MIISYQHKFIFIHCRKAAGSSVTSSLSRFLGDRDLQFSAIKDGVKQKIYPPKRVVREAMQQMTPGDYLAVMTFRKSFWSLVSNSVKKRYMDVLGESPSHAPASAVAVAFPDEWRDFFKFCIVRNPWDKTLSDYFWRTKRLQDPPTFDEFVRALEEGGLTGIAPKNHQNWDMYTIDDYVAVDHVVRFENLMDGLGEALAHTSVPWDGWMPHMKKRAGSGQERPKRNYREHYSEYAADAVGRLYAKEIDQFGYAF